MAKEKIAVPGHCFGVGGDGEVSAEGERKLTERSGSGVVYCNECSGAMAGFGEGGDVADLHGGVDGGFEPEEADAFEVLGLGVVCRGGEAECDAHVFEVFLGEDTGGVVGVRGEDDNVAGTQDGSEDGSAGGHSGGKDEGRGSIAFAGFELGYGFFEVGPGGIVGAGVGVGGVGWVAGGVVWGGEDWAGVKGLSSFGTGES